MMKTEISVAGHFGEFLQGRIGDRVLLASLPCPDLHVRLDLSPDEPLSVEFSGNPVLNEADILSLTQSVGETPTGRHRFTLNMPAGGGAGASTAARVAVLRLYRPDLSPDQMAQICLRSEGAVDPLMFPGAAQMIWASRQAETVATRPKLPKGRVIGGFYGPPRRTDPADSDFAEISDLQSAWTGATTLQKVAEISTESARRNRALRGPAEDPTFDLAKELGAIGVAVAHTGSARGLIFDPAQDVNSDRVFDTLQAVGFVGCIDFRF